MDGSHVEYDPCTGRRYHVFVRNECAQERPLVFYAGLGTVATGATTSRIWNNYMEAFAELHNGPIVHLHPEQATTAWRTYADRARSDAAVIEHLGVDQVDVSGVSAGGLLAAYVAAAAGRRAVNLVTASAVGTRRPIQYAQALPRQFIDSLRTSATIFRRSGINEAAGTGVGKLLNVARYPELFRTARQAAAASLAEAASELAPSTYWTSIVGNNDALTSISDHKSLIECRNRSYPGMSRLVVEQNMTHVWSSRTHDLARLVAQSIETRRLS